MAYVPILHTEEWPLTDSGRGTGIIFSCVSTWVHQVPIDIPKHMVTKIVQSKLSGLQTKTKMDEYRKGIYNGNGHHNEWMEGSDDD